jgi:ubiquinone/menaquinone biosynthesis C-methylase UbiE
MEEVAMVGAEPLNKVPVGELDPYAFFAFLGKRVVHPGGRRATEELFELGRLEPGLKVLDIGCGVGTTAIELQGRFQGEVTAADISPVMLSLAARNLERAGAAGRVRLRQADIVDLPFADASFDRVVAEAVTMFVDRRQAASELARVCRPGGLVLATEFMWRRPPTPAAREAFLGQVCPGMQFDTLEEWKEIYRSAGLTDLQVKTGPFEMMTPRGFLEDEGLANSLRVISTAVSRPAYFRRMAWLMPRIARAVPFLGYVVVAGVKPPATASSKEGSDG